MVDAEIYDGDMVIIEPREPKDGDIVAALIDQETTLKRYIQSPASRPTSKRKINSTRSSSRSTSSPYKASPKPLCAAYKHSLAPETSQLGTPALRRPLHDTRRPAGKRIKVGTPALRCRSTRHSWQTPAFRRPLHDTPAQTLLAQRPQ